MLRFQMVETVEMVIGREITSNTCVEYSSKEEAGRFLCAHVEGFLNWRERTTIRKTSRIMHFNVKKVKHHNHSVYFLQRNMWVCMCVLGTNNGWHLMSTYFTCFKYSMPMNSFAPHNTPAMFAVTIVPILQMMKLKFTEGRPLAWVTSSQVVVLPFESRWFDS